MSNFCATFQSVTRTRFLLLAAFFAAVIMFGTTSAFANHPVIVEGNCNFGASGHQNGPVAPGGICGDYDGDGRIGFQEDNDGVDRIFGTLTAALGANGINQNGTITIVTSGTFAEIIFISGNVTLQAAPGVEANIDAILQGDDATANAARQAHEGIIVDAPADRYVVIRNITSRNWTSGIQVRNNSRVTIENSRFEHNVNYGIDVIGAASRVAITKSEVHATGFRTNPATGNFPTANPPNPGHGISFRGGSSGIVSFTTVTGNFASAIINGGSGTLQFIPNSNTIFDNGVN